MATDSTSLRTFWSTDSIERTNKYKQIILDRHIELHDFAAILENSIVSQNTHLHGGFATNCDINQWSFPWHLTLTSKERMMGFKHSGIVKYKKLQYVTGYKQSASLDELYISLREQDTKSVFSYNLWDAQSCFDEQPPVYEIGPLQQLREMLINNNPSPITKIDITTINKDNIDNIENLFEKVNVYDLIPKGKTLSYFFPTICW